LQRILAFGLFAGEGPGSVRQRPSARVARMAAIGSWAAPNIQICQSSATRNAGELLAMLRGKEQWARFISISVLVWRGAHRATDRRSFSHLWREGGGKRPHPGYAACRTV